MLPTSRYDKGRADHAVDFIQNLEHTTGRWAGRRFKLMPWQERLVRDLFGIVKPNGKRQFNMAYIEVPKKNGKSELAAAIALYLTIADFEPSAEVYSCAADKDQASIVFRTATSMVERNSALSQVVKIVPSTKRLIYGGLNSFYRVLSSESKTKHGFNTHGVIFDELHAQPNRDLYDVMLHGSGDAREQPLFFIITTAGTDRNSICWEVHQKAQDIIEGRKIDPTFYPVIYGVADDDDWTDEKVWAKANPSLGITIDIEKIRVACESAKHNLAEENLFRRLRLNQWVKQTVRWMPMDKWDACDIAFDSKQLEGRECYAGLDLSSTTDVTAFVLVFPPQTEDEKYLVLPYFWIPEESLTARVRRDHVPYDIWRQQGFLAATEGNVIHYAAIEKHIEDSTAIYNIKEVAFDRWGATHLVQNLQGMGLTVIPFGQGFKDMSAPTKELHKLVLGGEIAHAGNPVLRWMADNVNIELDPAGNQKPNKAKSTERIDGIVALIMAIDRCMRKLEHEGKSIYDERGLLTF